MPPFNTTAAPNSKPRPGSASQGAVQYLIADELREWPFAELQIQPYQLPPIDSSVLAHQGWLLDSAEFSATKTTADGADGADSSHRRRMAV